MERPEGEGASRRTFLAYVAAALGTFMATMLAIPVIGSFISPAFARKAGGQWARLGSAAGFAPGQPKAVPFYLVKKDGTADIEPNPNYIDHPTPEFMTAAEFAKLTKQFV